MKRAPLARIASLDVARPRLARRVRVSSPEVSCGEVAVALPSILDGGSAADEAVVEHVGRCLRCQSELAKYHKLLRLLNQLRGARVEPPPGAVTDVLDAIEDAAQRRVIRSALSGRRLVYAGPSRFPWRRSSRSPSPVVAACGAWSPWCYRDADPGRPVLSHWRATTPARRAVAQLVEHRSPKPAVGGSSPSCPAHRSFEPRKVS